MSRSSVIIDVDRWRAHGGKIMRLIRDQMCTDDYRLRWLRDENKVAYATEIIFSEPCRATEFLLRYDPKDWT